jgi:hypothetical protein
LLLGSSAAQANTVTFLCRGRRIGAVASADLISPPNALTTRGGSSERELNEANGIVLDGIGTDISGKPAPHSSDAAWEAMLVAFRALGGSAENVRLGHGTFGRGLFPVDPTKPILLRLPENLLFSVDDVEFVEERMRIRDSAHVAKPEREFFETYENTFSWGGEGRLQSEEFIAALDSLPSDVRAALIVDFGMGDLLEGDRTERIRRRFLKSRLISWNGKNVMTPLIELANHDPGGLLYAENSSNYLEIQGKAQEEVFICYGKRDSFGIFSTFGFADRQEQAFSFPMKTNLQAFELTITWDIAAQVRRGNFFTPQLRREGNNFYLSYLMIGHTQYPRLSRGIFVALMRDIGLTDADEVFDTILHLNRIKFLNLLAVLDPYESEIIVTLRRMARYQLEAMAYCVGIRQV